MSRIARGFRFATQFCRITQRNIQLPRDLCPEGFANFTAFIRRLPSFELRDFRKDNLHFIKCQLVQAGKEDRLFLCVARSEEHTSELQSLMRISYAVFCLKKKKANHAQ